MQAAGDFDAMPKKEALATSASSRSSSRNLGGISRLDRLPDAIFVIDTKKEHIAVTEANKLRPAGGRRGRHQLRSRRHRLRDPGQRRRHPLRHAHVPGHRRRRGRGALHRRPPASAPGASPEPAAAAGPAPPPPAGRRRRAAPSGADARRRRAGRARAPARPRRPRPTAPPTSSRRRGAGRRAGPSRCRPPSAGRGRRRAGPGRRPRRPAPSPPRPRPPATRRPRRPTRRPTHRARRTERWQSSPPRTSRRSARPPAPGCSTPSGRSRRPTATWRRPSSGCASRGWPARPSARTGSARRARSPSSARTRSRAIVELRCETDFVAKSAEFVSLVDELAALVAAKGEDAWPSARTRSTSCATTLEGEHLGRPGGPLRGRRRRGRSTPTSTCRPAGASTPCSSCCAGGTEALAHDIAVHIAFARPTYLRREDVPEAEVAAERATVEAISRNEGKPEAALPKIVEGRLNGWFKERVPARPALRPGREADRSAGCSARPRWSASPRSSSAPERRRRVPARPSGRRRPRG